MNRLNRAKLICLLLALSMLAGCGSIGAKLPSSSSSSSSEKEVSRGGMPDEDEKGAYIAPPFADSVFNGEKAQGNERAKIDVSAVSDGYVAVMAKSEKRLKFQVICGDVKYNYDLSSSGEPSVFPLQSGSGYYRFRIMENTVDSKYAELYSAECSVKLSDDFQPFLRPNDYVPYTQDSKCVKQAEKMAKTAGDALGVVSAVYKYVTSNIKYDKKKAETVQSGYMPDPDETMRTGKGICFDYAALTAAMLRSQGIPTKVIFGYVSPSDVYHAWNMFYTEETGWVTVSFEVKKDTWNRLDLTFIANGADSKFIGDGGNYSDLYFY